MALVKRHSVSTFVIEFLWILFLVFQESNLVICDGLEDDSLNKALEAIERRQRDLELQENDYYGQPENIGYGFQKTLGFFDNTGPATDLGSFDSNRNTDPDLQNLFSYSNGDADYDTPFEKRKSNFRERTPPTSSNSHLISQRRDDDEDEDDEDDEEDEEDDDDGGDEHPQVNHQYVQLLRKLWAKYRKARPEDVTIENLTDDEVEGILSSFFEKGNRDRMGRFAKDYYDPSGYGPFQILPVRTRKNYRVFDGFGGRNKRYPALKRNSIGRHSPLENDFLYSLKYVNPELNREAVESLREGFEVTGDDKDRDIMRVLQGGRSRHAEEDEPYWRKEQQQEEEEEDAWLPGPLAFPDKGYEAFGRNEKRGEFAPRVFKNHDGIHLTGKRFPVKRSPVRVRKEAGNEKVAKEVKGIFATTGETSTQPPKKTTTKKPTEMGKKNVTKPEVTKHHEGKKMVRRSEKYTKEMFPDRGNEEIMNIFKVDKKSKKSIDWSQYFGLDKRAGAGWLKEDHLRRAEGHLLSPKSKRYPFERVEGSQYEMPFDTRKFDKKYSYDIGSNIDRVEDKIGDIEEKIIDDAVKYTGAHSGGGTENLSQVKNKVMQRLEAAYSLEKMKNALEEFKNLIGPGKKSEGARKTSTESPKAEARTTVPKESSNLEKPLSEKKGGAEVKKKIATKKEGVKGSSGEDVSGSVEFLNEVFGRKQYENEGCPILEKILHNCLRVEEMGGRYAELLVPLCSLQQMCYFCGAELGFAKMSTCDAVYLSGARNVCQDDSNCLVSARNSMLALQDLYEQDVLGGSGHRVPSDSCWTNPCIERYFLNAPGAIYPLEMQK